MLHSGHLTDYTVGEVTQLSGVSVRTLHHYDAIGLVTPADRSASSYRLYAEVDVERLRRLLHYRELGFGLEAVAEILADPTVGAEAHLRQLRRCATCASCASCATNAMSEPRRCYAPSE